MAFGGERKEVVRYAGELGAAQRIGIKRGIVTGALLGSMMAIFFSSYSLAFWYATGIFSFKKFYTFFNLKVWLSISY